VHFFQFLPSDSQSVQKFAFFWYLYWSIRRKKGFLFYFMTKILPIWPPLVNGLLVPPSPQNLPNHLGTRSEVYHTRRDAIPRCNIHRRVTIPRWMMHRRVGIPRCSFQCRFFQNFPQRLRGVSCTAESSFQGVRYTAESSFRGISYTAEQQFWWISPWMFSKNQNRPSAPLMGPEGTIWWKKPILKNLVTLSL